MFGKNPSSKRPRPSAALSKFGKSEQERRDREEREGIAAIARGSSVPSVFQARQNEYAERFYIGMPGVPQGDAHKARFRKDGLTKANKKKADQRKAMKAMADKAKKKAVPVATTGTSLATKDVSKQLAEIADLENSESSESDRDPTEPSEETPPNDPESPVMANTETILAAATLRKA